MLMAYARVFAAGVRGPDASFGRLVVDPRLRGTGLGKVLVADAIEQCERLSPGCPVRIQAQLYLERFYADFGFRRVSETYEEDGIPHVDMVRPPERES
jgi:ElaA protein